MRMLFGANTVKPDVHVSRFMKSCLGHSVSDLRQVQLLEEAALLLGIRAIDLDTTIWERAAREGLSGTKPRPCPRSTR